MRGSQMFVRDKIAHFFSKPLFRSVVFFPYFIFIFIVAFCTLNVLLLLGGVLTNAMCLIATLVSIVAALIAVRLLKRRSIISSDKTSVIAVSLALLFVVAWGIFNSFYVSEDLFIRRDPGVYNTAARWIMDNPSLKMYKSDFIAGPGVNADTAGYYPVKSETNNRLYVQAPHALPILAGTFARIFGEGGLLRANVIIGSVALLMFFTAASLFMKRRYALIATILLGISLPFVYFSRDTYSETLALLMVFGAVIWFEAARRAGSGRLLWTIAGAAVASSVLVRIDGYLAVAGFVGALMLMYVLDRFWQKSEHKKVTPRNIGAFIIGSTVIAAVSTLDLYFLSRKYFFDLIKEFYLQIGLSVVLIIVGFIAVRYAPQIARFLKKFRRQIVLIFAAICIVFSLFLLVRPVFMEGYDKGNIYSRAYLASLQIRDGDEINMTRSYSEYTAYWQMWYIGPLICLLGMLGVILAVRGILYSRDPRLLPLLAITVTAAGLYLLQPHITPDQIWSIRRYLPVIMPGIIILGFFALEAMIGRIHIKTIRSLLLKGAILIAIFAPVAFITGPFVTATDYKGRLAAVKEVCRVIPAGAKLVVLAPSGINITQTFRSYCGIEAVRITGEAAPESLKHLTLKDPDDAKNIYVLVLGTERFLVNSEHNFTIVSADAAKEMRRELNHPPRSQTNIADTYMLGKLDLKSGKVNGI